MKGDLKKSLLEELKRLEEDISEQRKHKMGIGDLVCFKKNYSRGNSDKTYGIVIEEKIGLKNIMSFRIKWFCDWYPSWHADPSEIPIYRKSELFVVSSANSLTGENNGSKTK
jgi:hypothetical protein